MSVGVGEPATEYNLVIDTGSSNTWVGAKESYVRTSTSTNTGESFSVTYGSGSVKGTEFFDTVTIAPGLVISQQSIGVASKYSGDLNGLDGILGLGPVDLTSGTLSDTSAQIPTVVDNLFSQGTITSNLIGLSFEPVVSRHGTYGEITFGGVDSSKFTGSLSFAPITSTSPANQFWGVDASITYGHGQTLMSTTAGIVDSGTSLMLIASDVFQKFKEITGAAMDEATGLLKLSAKKYHNLHPLFFNIGGEQYELTVNAYTWPRHLNTEIGGRNGDIYLTIADLGTNSGQGMDFILGVPFFERFYVVFDTANQQVGKL
jgi:cathepsin E